MRAYKAGAHPQRHLWPSTGTKDPKASDVLYVKALAAPFTVNTMPEATLKAAVEHGDVGAAMPADGGDCEEMLAQFARAGLTSMRCRPSFKMKAPVFRQFVERPDGRDWIQMRHS